MLQKVQTYVLNDWTAPQPGGGLCSIYVEGTSGNYSDHFQIVKVHFQKPGVHFTEVKGP
jgi:hypothetical protein